ncbi:MAG: efflux RND transporter permease subunit [Rickettsiales bacterium]|jgi:multidrug efflux pump|nr:efflux RND transporter permease subunit [Rickettsiales bacterium]
MEKITKFALKNNRVTILFLIVGIMLGTWSALNMPRQEDPTVTIRVAQINAYFPGMSTELTEDLIAKPLERKLREISEIEDINTIVTTGHVLLQPKLYDRYFDLDPIWQDLRNKMDEVKSELPQGTTGPFVNDDFGRVAAATVAIYGDDFTIKTLYDTARDIKDHITNLNGLSKIELYGEQKEQIYLEFNIATLSNYGLQPNNIVNSLTSQNIITSSGSIEVNGKKLQLEVSGRFTSLDEINNLSITSPKDNLPVYLRDIAKVKREFISPPTRPVYYNNHPAIILSFSMLEQYNIEQFGKDLSKKIESISESLPVGLEVDFATYQPDLVTKSVKDTIINLLETVLVVLVIVIAFLGIRNGFIVGMIVPITIMLTLIIMELVSIDLQNMSIAAIIIALGLLVDDAIIITEDIASRAQTGTPINKAIIETIRSLAYPSLISSLTTMLAFMPLAMSQNVTGEYLSSLSYVIVIALFISWFLSIYAVPVLCSYFIKPNTSTAKPDAADVLTTQLKSSYRKVLKLLLRFPFCFLSIMITLLLISAYSLKFIPKQMLPYSDRNQYLVYVDLPAGSSVEATKKSTRILTEWLENKTINPEITSNVAYIGFGGPRFVLSLSPPDAKDNVAFVIVNTESGDQVANLIDRTNRFINDNIPEVSARAKQMWMGGQEIGLLEYRVTGTDGQTLYHIAGEIEKIIKSHKGAIGVVNDWQNPISTFKIIIDQNRAQRANVSSKSVAQSLNSYLDGYDIGNYYDGDDAIPIILRGDDNRNRISELRTLPVFTNDGKTVPLIQIADFRADVNLSMVKRRNQERNITVSVKHQTLQATEFHEQLLPEIKTIKLPEGYKISFGGELESSANANKSLFANLPYAIIGMAILIILQFNSFRRTIIILLTIPLVLIGAVFGLWIGNAFLSFTAILGMFSLAGIVINNGIILIDKADIGCREGTDVTTAMTNACIVRLRPILITSLTTIIGLIPMTLFGGDMWYPMAIVIMAGLFVGTVLTLGVVPVLYVLFNKGFWQPKLQTSLEQPDDKGLGNKEFSKITKEHDADNSNTIIEMEEENPKNPTNE